jgi:hypothetical protein
MLSIDHGSAGFDGLLPHDGQRGSTLQRTMLMTRQGIGVSETCRIQRMLLHRSALPAATVSPAERKYVVLKGLDGAAGQD